MRGPPVLQWPRVAEGVALTRAGARICAATLFSVGPFSHFPPNYRRLEDVQGLFQPILENRPSDKRSAMNTVHRYCIDIWASTVASRAEELWVWEWARCSGERWAATQSAELAEVPAHCYRSALGGKFRHYNPNPNGNSRMLDSPVP